MPMTHGWTKLAASALLVLVAGHSARAQRSRWVETHRWEGAGTQQTESFLANGSKWRVFYIPGDASKTSVLQVAVYDLDGELLDMLTNQSGTSILRGFRTRRDRGERYLAINGIGVTWTVIVQQHLSAIEEWHLMELARNNPPDLLKLGTWTGDDTDTEYEFTIPAGSWQIAHEHTGRGLLQVMVTDAEGFVGLAANVSQPGTATSWVHRAGTFRMHIRANGVRWRIDVLGRRNALQTGTEGEPLQLAPIQEPIP